jgi:hypothetical protein
VPARWSCWAEDPATAPAWRRRCDQSAAGPVPQDRQRRGHRDRSVGRRAGLVHGAYPGRAFAKGKNDPAFRTNLQIDADLAARARDAGFAFRAVTTDCAYGEDGFRGEIAEAGLPLLMALKPRRAILRTPVDAAHAVGWSEPTTPGDGARCGAHTPRGHTETLHAADATLG